MPEPSEQMTSQQRDRLGELCFRYLDGLLSDTELIELNAMLREYEEARALFAAYGRERFVLRDLLTTAHEETDAASILEGLASLEAASGDAELVDLTEEMKRRDLAKRRQQHERLAGPRRMDSTSSDVHNPFVIPKAVVWLGLAAVLGFAAVVVSQLKPDAPVPSQAPPVAEVEPEVGPEVRPTPAPVVATLVRSLEARWYDGRTAWDGRGGLRQGRHYLMEGLAEIELASGTRVVLEAPLSFVLTGTNAMRLDNGRLVAHVPVSGIGFTVDTPTAQIVDYGTEFGVHADGRAQTQVHVYQGEVRAAARVQGEVVGELIPLEQGQAAAIDAGGQAAARIAFDASGFERRVVKRLDMVDMIAGGDGLGQAAGRGIDPRTGEAVEHAAMASLESDALNIRSFTPLRRVSLSPMIDSVFVIDRYRGFAVLDTGGAVFDKFPRSSAGVMRTDFFGHSFVQAIDDGNVVMPLGERGHIDQPFSRVGRSELDGRAVVLHGGAGITFDLDEIARGHGGLRPSRFSAQALNAEAINQASKQLDESASADIWVLVDGEPRFEVKGIRTADGVIEIDVELLPDDRFLSLVVSDAGDSIAHDWLIFSQPVVEISPPEGAN